MQFGAASSAMHTNRVGDNCSTSTPRLPDPRMHRYVVSASYVPRIPPRWGGGGAAWHRPVQTVGCRVGSAPVTCAASVRRVAALARSLRRHGAPQAVGPPRRAPRAPPGARTSGVPDLLAGPRAVGRRAGRGAGAAGGAGVLLGGVGGRVRRAAGAVRRRRLPRLPQRAAGRAEDQRGTPLQMAAGEGRERAGGARAGAGRRRHRAPQRRAQRAAQAVPGGGPGGLSQVRRAAVVPHVRGRLLQRHHAHHTRVGGAVHAAQGVRDEQGAGGRQP